MKQGQRGYWVDRNGSCSDCLDRNALNYVGIPRVHKYYGYKLSTGCESCGGTGRSAVKITNLAEIVQNPTGRKLKRRLTPKQRFVMELYYGLKDGEKYTVREIASLMGVHFTTVQEHLQSARGKLDQYAP